MINDQGVSITKRHVLFCFFIPASEIPKFRATSFPIRTTDFKAGGKERGGGKGTGTGKSRESAQVRGGERILEMLLILA